jgi:hypothetical protein
MCDGMQVPDPISGGVDLSATSSQIQNALRRGHFHFQSDIYADNFFLFLAEQWAQWNVEQL